MSSSQLSAEAASPSEAKRQLQLSLVLDLVLALALVLVQYFSPGPVRVPMMRLPLNPTCRLVYMAQHLTDIQALVEYRSNNT